MNEWHWPLPHFFQYSFLLPFSVNHMSDSVYEANTSPDYELLNLFCSVVVALMVMCLFTNTHTHRWCCRPLILLNPGCLGSSMMHECAACCLGVKALLQLSLSHTLKQQKGKQYLQKHVTNYAIYFSVLIIYFVFLGWAVWGWLYSWSYSNP